MKVFLFLSLISVSAFAAPLKLALNWKPEPQFGGFYAAQTLGEFKRQGLDMQILEGGSGTPTVQMLANKKVDFAIVSAEEIIISQARNPKNKVIALFAVFQTNPQILMCRKDRGFKSIEDIFKNKGVLSLQSGLTYAQFLLKKYQPIQVNVVPYQGGISHILSQKDYSQQGFLTSEPLLAEAAGISVQSFLVADSGFNPYTTVLAVHQDSLKDAELVKKVVSAVKKGWTEYLKDPKTTNEFMSSLNKSMGLKTFEKSAQLQIPLIETEETKKIGLGQMSSTRWKALVDQLLALKVIPKELKTQDLFTNRFN